MGLLELVISESRDAVIGSAYQAGSKTLVFDVPAGKVVYITSVSYSRGQSDTVYYSTLSPDYHSDIAAARNFMRKHYPALADRLEQGSFRIMPGS